MSVISSNYFFVKTIRKYSSESDKFVDKFPKDNLKRFNSFFIRNDDPKIHIQVFKKPQLKLISFGKNDKH
jgi:hypothetical protein